MLCNCLVDSIGMFAYDKFCLLDAQITEPVPEGMVPLAQPQRQLVLRSSGRRVLLVATLCKSGRAGRIDETVEFKFQGRGVYHLSLWHHFVVRPYIFIVYFYCYLLVYSEFILNFAVKRIRYDCNTT